MTEIQVGQLWADNDPRAKGRTLQVVEIGTRFVSMKVITDRKDVVRSTVGLTFHINKDRMKPTKNGYILVR